MHGASRARRGSIRCASIGSTRSNGARPHSTATRARCSTRGSPRWPTNTPDAPQAHAAPARASSRGALAGLVERLARDAQADRRGIDPELVDYFRATWAKVRTEQQYRQSLDQVPRNAGPLNSNSLVHRSLSTMRELSPAYLQQFLSYVDALACLEDLVGAGAQPDKDAARTKAAKPAKPTKKGTRTRVR